MGGGCRSQGVGGLGWEGVIDLKQCGSRFVSAIGWRRRKEEQEEGKGDEWGGTLNAVSTPSLINVSFLKHEVDAERDHFWSQNGRVSGVLEKGDENVFSLEKGVFFSESKVEKSQGNPSVLDSQPRHRLQTLARSPL